MTIEMIELWHRRARPAPTVRDLKTQLGCHFEEIAEMMEALSSDTPFIKDRLDQMRHNAEILAHCCKQGDDVAITDRKECLDALADQIVTAIGVAYCAGMKPEAAVDQVNKSNWSKFDENGQPVRDNNGKIIKGPYYRPPVLDGLY